MFFKNKIQQRKQGLDQLLNFSILIEDNIILNKDGSLMSGFYYTASDVSNISKQEAHNIVEKINQASKILTEGFTIYFDVIRFASNNYSKSEENHFPDAVSQAIDEERRRQFQQENSHFESKYIIIICYHQHQKYMDNLDKWLFSNVEEKSNFGKVLLKFKNITEEFTKLLSYTIKISPMKTTISEQGYVQDELCNYLHSSLTGETKRLKLSQPMIDLDLRLCNRDFIAGNICKMGNKYIQTISITDFPDATYANILNALDMINIPYRWSTRFMFVDKIKSESILEKKEKSWDEAIYTYKDMLSGKMGMSMGKPNRHALNMSYDANIALNEDRSGITKYGYYTTTIIVMHEDVEVVKSNAKFIAEVIESSNFDAYVEGINTADAFFSTIAGHIHCNKRKTPINTLNLASLIQTSSVYCGEEYAPNPFLPPNSPPLAYARTNGSNPYRLNLHVRDVGVTIIVGPIGNGKSTLLAFLLAQYLRYPNAKIFIFDKKESLYALTKSVNGIHYYLGKDEMSLCPLALVKDTESLSWAVNYLVSIIEMQGQTVNASQKHMLMLAVQAIEKQANKSLSALLSLIQDENLKFALRQYTKSGTLGTLLDGNENILNQGSITTFELDSLLKMGEKNVVAVLGYLFYYIESKLDGSPTVIALEEVWLVMLRNFFKEKFTEWLVTLRKQNCIVVFTCQNLAQLYQTDSSTLSAIIDSTATKIFLPNKEAGQKGTLERAGNYELYKMFGLNDHEITQIISKAIPKRDYYIKQEHGSRLVQFDFGATTLKYCGISGTDEVAEFKRQEKSINKKEVEYV